MYKNVLLTDKEMSLLKRVVGDYLHEKIVPEAKNLTIILNRLRQIKVTNTYNQTVNYGKWAWNGSEIDSIGKEWVIGPQKHKLE